MRIIKILAVTVAAVMVIGLAACAKNTSAPATEASDETEKPVTGFPEDAFWILGRFFKLTDGRYLIVEHNYAELGSSEAKDTVEQPVIVTPADSFPMDSTLESEEFSNGDTVRATVGTIAESWPAQAVIYEMSHLELTDAFKDIDIPEVSQELTERLAEMGYEFDNRTAYNWDHSEANGQPLSEEEQKVWDKALDGFTGVGYEPITLLGTQVVAGTNYAFLAKSTVIVPGADTTLSVVTVYEDLEGNCEILSIEDFDLDGLLERAVTPVEDQPDDAPSDADSDFESIRYELVAGGWEWANWNRAAKLPGGHFAWQYGRVPYVYLGYNTATDVYIDAVMMPGEVWFVSDSYLSIAQFEIGDYVEYSGLAEGPDTPDIFNLPYYLETEDYTPAEYRTSLWLSEETGRFQFFISPLDSWYHTGNYELTDEYLILTDEQDKDMVYYFSLSDNEKAYHETEEGNIFPTELTFLADKSYPIPDYNVVGQAVKDGDVFIFGDSTSVSN